MAMKKMSLEKKHNLTGWLFLLPASLLIFVFCFYPMVQALILSFKSGMGNTEHWVAIANYTRILKDKTFQQCLFNTIFYFVIQVPIMLLLSLILAQLLNSPAMAYDADSGDGTVYEYNYSRMNEGGCVMFCLEEAIHNTFRHNVSYDDLGGTISPASNPDARLEQNIFYVRDGVPFVRNHMDGGNYTESNDRIIPIEK